MKYILLPLFIIGMVANAIVFNYLISSEKWGVDLGDYEQKKDTVYIKVPYIKYLDTCDSQFMKSIIEVETRNYSKLKKKIPLKTKPTGGGGLYIGQFQMSRIYFEGCTLAEVLGYSYNQMFEPEKAMHVFWAKMGVYAYRFKKQHGRPPTYEELARIHAGGYSQRFKPSTDKYANHFNKWYNTKLD